MAVPYEPAEFDKEALTVRIVRLMLSKHGGDYIRTMKTRVSLCMYHNVSAVGNIHIGSKSPF